MKETKNRFRLVAFDLDGTILYTLEDLNLSLNHALKAHGYPPCTVQQTRSYVGDGAEMLIRRACPPGGAAGNRPHLRQGAL